MTGNLSRGVTYRKKSDCMLDQNKTNSSAWLHT